GVLVHGDEAGNAAAFSEDFAHAMTGGLGRCHADVDGGVGHDSLEMDVEAVGEEQGFAGGEVGRNFVGVEVGGGLVGNEDHDTVGPLDGVGDGCDFKAGLLRLGDGLGAGGEAYLDLNAGVLEVERVGVSLGAVPDDGHLFGLDEREVGVVIIVSLG